MTARVPSVPAMNDATSKPLLGQQVLQAVARDLTTEPAELGADRAQACAHDLAQSIHRGRRRRGTAHHPQLLTRRRHQVQTSDVVGAAAVPQGAIAAGVVADHAADGAPGVGRRIGSVAQSVRRGGPLQGGMDHARVDPRRSRLEIHLVHPVEVAAEVHHDSRADRVAGDRRASSARCQRHSGLGAGGHDRQHLLDAAGTHHHGWLDAVQRGIGAVERAGQGRVVDVADTKTPQACARRRRRRSGHG